jgi:hypothetical protein
VTESFWLVFAGGVIGIAGSVIPLLLQRRWARVDRRRAADAKALEAAVQKLMAWQDFANLALSKGDTGSVRERLRESDLAWEADLSLIPDQAATQELVTMVRDIFFFGGVYRDAPDVMERSAHLMRLLDRVISSAQKKRRELA